MHIPDTAISPATSLAAAAVMVPVWTIAGRRVRTSLATKQTPLLAIGAAFCFTIMMFNIPVPGGTTVHPVGGALLAILLGPWAACIGVTAALVIQALFFGDGGVFALGANCFTMAFAMPFAGYLVYSLLAGKSAASAPRRAFAAGAGAYIGLSCAALLTAVILGLQPSLFHEPNGHALYFPFGLKVTIPAIMTAHMLIAGVAEAVVTTLVVRYLQSASIPLYGLTVVHKEGHAARKSRRRELLWVGLIVLAALSPLGLLAKGDAWGEWGAGDVAKQAGYMPRQLAAVEAHGWKGFNLLPDYLSDKGPAAYVAAALMGILLISVLLLVLARVLTKRVQDESTPGEGGPAGPPNPTVKSGEVPAWMLSVNASESIEPNTEKLETRSRAKPNFVEKTIVGLADATQETLFAEKWARKEGLLQRLDPRIKIITTLLLVIVASLMRHITPLLGLYFLSIGIAAASRLPFTLMIKRVWLAVPLFVGAVTLPAALNIVTPGPSLLVLSTHPFLAVTRPGAVLAVLLTLRVGVAVTFVVLLTLTTQWQDLLRGLRVLFVPKLFLSVLAMTYRYFGVLMQSASDLFTARKSRTVGVSARQEERLFLGAAMGALFGKTLALTDEVHSAMLSRGWSGEAQTLRPLRLQAADWLWAGAMGCTAVGALLMEGLFRWRF